MFSKCDTNGLTNENKCSLINSKTLSVNISATVFVGTFEILIGGIIRGINIAKSQFQRSARATLRLMNMSLFSDGKSEVTLSFAAYLTKAKVEGLTSFKVNCVRL